MSTTGLNRNTDHEGIKTREWQAGHREHYKKYQHDYHKSREYRSQQHTLRVCHDLIVPILYRLDTPSQRRIR